jgi:hypothetical protein
MTTLAVPTVRLSLQSPDLHAWCSSTASCAEFQGAARKYAASVIMTVAYGKTTPTQYSDRKPINTLPADPGALSHTTLELAAEVQAINKFGHRLGHALRPGAYHVDSYPILKYFPGQWKRDGAQHHKEELALFAGQLDKVREGIRTGQGVDCLARTMIGQQQGECSCAVLIK